MTHAQHDFEALFADSDDPWHFRSLWYEERKRGLTLACLPLSHFGSIYEPGCANGELTALLAPRCDRLLATDGASGAVAVARQRLACSSHVTIEQAWLPDEWPDQRFDLIVISELAYYLDDAGLTRLIARARDSLQPSGSVIACHWRHPIEACAFDGDAVHARLDVGLGLPHLLQVVDDDLRLDVWSLDGRSVAQRDGLA